MRRRLKKKLSAGGRIATAGKLAFSAAKPALNAQRMLSFMLETRYWVGVSPARGFFSKVYSRGEEKIRPFVFKRLKIPSEDERLLSKAIGGMYVDPDKRALESLVKKYGPAKAKGLLMKLSSEAELQVRFARKAMADYNRISGVESISDARSDKQRLEQVVSDMFVQPLAAMAVTSKMLMHNLERQRARTGRQNL